MFGTMSIGGVLDVAIGLMFIYFLLAQIATGLQEVLAGFAAWRGSYLTKGVDVLMSNDNVAFNFWKDFFATHFLPRAPPTEAERKLANPPPPQPQQAAAAAPPQQPQPAAAPPPHTPAQLLTNIQNVMNHPLMRGNPSANPPYIPAQKFSMALLDLLRNGSQAPLFTQAEATVNNLPNGQLKETLSVFIRDAGGDIDKLRTHIETWFDDAMDELSTIYKRLSRFAMLIIGLIVAVAVNVDSIRVAKFLWASPVAASDLANAAQQAKSGASDQNAAAQEAAGQAALTQLRGLTLPIGWHFADDATKGAATTAPALPLPPQTSGATEKDACVQPPGAIYSVRLSAVQKCHGLDMQNWPTDTRDRIMRVVGWLITAIAISLGAPFWFGLMQNLLNIRSASKPPRADATPAPAPKTSRSA
jgi:hypothetical protein